MAFKIVFTQSYTRIDQVVRADYFTDENPGVFTTFKTSNGKTVLSLRTDMIQEVERVPESTVENMTEEHQSGKEDFLKELAGLKASTLDSTARERELLILLGKEYNSSSPSRYTVFYDSYTLSAPLHLVVDREEKKVIAKYAGDARSGAEAHSNRLNLENK